MSNQFPVIRQSQRDVDNEDAYINEKALLKRFQVSLPDLSEVIDPNSSEYHQIINGLQRFELDRGGLSPASVKQLASVLRLWIAYCDSKGVFAFPITTRFALGWFKFEASNNKSVATIHQYKNQLSYLQRWFKLPTNPLAHEAVLNYISSIKKDIIELNEESYTQKQAFALRSDDLKFLINNMHVGSTYSLRNLALVSLGYATALRKGEYSAIKLKHLKFDPVNNTCIVQRTKSKTSTNVKKKVITSLFCKILQLYIHRIKHQLTPDSYVFTHVTKEGRLSDTNKPINSYSINLALKEMFEFAQMNGHVFASPEPKCWTSHSMRVGATQDAFLRGESTPVLMSVGDWTSLQMPMYYVRELDQNESATVTNQSEALKKIGWVDSD